MESDNDGKEDKQRMAQRTRRIASRGRTFIADIDKADILQYRKMLRDSGLIRPDLIGQVADTHLLLLEQVEHQQPARMRRRLSDLRASFIPFSFFHSWRFRHIAMCYRLLPTENSITSPSPATSR